ncbi:MULTISPECIES: hypothetical protein [unclassified Pseudomonas]|uniref:hypothetical protein n=1 Tax=unclassified Pseudomonas TaxID=196821 RepID=UPI000C881B08|nr:MULTISPECIES: hypothetical protein [unclassified Pseudomonas]PMZ99429.1 hypothetical protein C1X79_07955 [Pseudomonas sp. FW305-42]PNA23182.1 hypothetical protein C1X78_14295 [Pseudomonas sp. MPR-R1B]PNB25814.1 hypothetical protein C1X80_12935 [Pseudomonas sp. DP16D-E2]PNB41810.1 hypothetical protein C1X75_18915 [Pseudomonas sp. FW305-17]PNB60805.1 hypothetical protein C1X77_13475 [Pseudomonas sp. GW531-E2]
MNKPVSKQLSGQLLRPAGKRSRVLFPQGGVLEFKDLIVEGLVDDGVDNPAELLPVAAHDKPLTVRVPNWDEVEEGMVIALYVNGDDELEGVDGAWHSVTRAEEADPTHKFPLALPSSYWDFVAKGEDRTFQVGYSVRPEFSGEYERGPNRVIRIDKLAPGGNPGTLARLSFAADIEARQRILKTDFVAGMLTVHVRGYLAQRQGDQIMVTITDGTTPLLVGPFSVTSSTDATPVELPLAELQKLKDNTPIKFTYTSQDRAGNLSIVSVPHDTLQLLLQDIPVVLPTPEVPGFDQPGDPLILDKDARAGIRLVVPTVTGARIGDEVVVLWGTQRSDKHEVTVVRPSPDPLLEPYLLYPLTSAGPQTGAVAVSYELWRDGFKIGDAMSTATVNVDLRLPGGPDPDPELPGHGNLKLATIVGNDSGQADDLTPEDVAAGAQVTIPWFAVDGSELLEEDDELELIWGEQPPHALDPVSAAEAAAEVDITRRVPSTVLASEPSGTVQMAYTVTRVFGANGEENTALSPSKPVAVLRGQDLPGEGTALKALEFTDLNRFGAIDIEKAQRPLPVKIELYDNVEEGDTIVIHLRADDSQRPTPGNPISAAEEDLDFIRIEAHHKRAGELTLEIARRWAFIVCSGSATVEYTATNAHGPVKAGHMRVPVTVREPSQPTCPLP